MNQSDRYFPFMCEAIGHNELLDDERFIGMENRTEHRRELITILDNIFITKTRPEWTEILNKSADIVWERVQDVFDLPDDPQVIANNYLVDFDHPVLGPTKWLQTPLGYNKTPISTRKMAPAHGENTEEVLMEALGYTWDDIGALQEAGAIL
jgi:crotonobetainyl-CoA:carnitine CoA-transferase CaiB-like acyl-CoA transferase